MCCLLDDENGLGNGDASHYVIDAFRGPSMHLASPKRFHPTGGRVRPRGGAWTKPPRRDSQLSTAQSITPVSKSVPYLPRSAGLFFFNDD